MVDGPERGPERTLQEARRQPPAWVAAEASFFLTVCARPRGKNQLCRPVVSGRLQAIFDWREAQGLWVVHAGVLMPDHLHILVTVPDARQFNPLIAAWKRYTACHLGIRWHRTFFDRRLRRHESLTAKVEYIRQNPVRAGLVSRPEDWPYLWVR